jgi:FkbH-like protein
MIDPSQLRTVVAEILDVPENKLTPETHLASFGSYDSTAQLSLMVCLSDLGNRQFGLDDIRKVVTYGDILTLTAEWASKASRKEGLQVYASTASWLRTAPAADSDFIDGQTDSDWARVVDPAGRDLPEVLVQRARLAWQQDNRTLAAGLLKQAFYCDWNTPALLRAETLLSKVLPEQRLRKSLRIAVLASGNGMMIQSALRMLCWRDGIGAEFYQPDFGTWHHEILSRDSNLYRFGPDIIVMLLNWRDIGLQNDAAASTVALWDSLLSQLDCTIIYATATRPAADPAMGLSLRTPDGIARVIDDFNRDIANAAGPRVLLVDSNAIASKVPGPWEDLRQWTTSRVYPSLEALPLLAEAIESHIRAACGFSSKLVAVDLDNTLWGGIIGEDGIGGIKLGPPSPEGEQYQILQHYLRSLTEQGVLLIALSKNNHEDAARVFTDHDACVLKLSDFAAFEANWDAKPDNLRRLATTLRLGADSFVFLDDNPAERTAMRLTLPEVVVPEISGDPVETIAVLDRFQFFQTSSLTEEDRNRAASYRALAALGSTPMNQDELLSSLQIEIETGPVNETTAGRVTQLINKTNQFNLTTRRYTVAEVEELMKSRSHWFRWFRLRDRFADHGLVGLLLADNADTPELRVNLWLMSCRVIGRKLEDFMCQTLLDAAGDAGAWAVYAEYVETPKNALVRDLLPRMGFQQTRDGETVYYKSTRESETHL